MVGRKKGGKKDNNQLATAKRRKGNLDQKADAKESGKKKNKER